MHHLGADEAPLEVGVDPARGPRRPVAAVDGPGAHLVLAHGEERSEVEQVVGGADEALARGLAQPDRLQEGRLLGRVQVRDLRLDLRA